MGSLRTGRAPGCVRPRGDPPSDNGNEADGVFAGKYAGPLVHGQVRAFAKQRTMNAGGLILQTLATVAPCALNGQPIPAQGIALGTSSERIGVF